MLRGRRAAIGSPGGQRFRVGPELANRGRRAGSRVLGRTCQQARCLLPRQSAGHSRKLGHAPGTGATRGAAPIPISELAGRRGPGTPRGGAGCCCVGLPAARPCAAGRCRPVVAGGGGAHAVPVSGLAGTPAARLDGRRQHPRWRRRRGWPGFRGGQHAMARAPHVRARPGRNHRAPVHRGGEPTRLDFSLEVPPLATPALARLALWLPLGLAWACRARPGWRALGLASLGSVLVACVPTRADPVDHPAALSISPAARLFHALCQFAAFFVRLGGQFGGQLPSLSRAEADSAQLTNGTHILSSTMSWTRLRLRRSPARCAPPRSARTYTYPCGDRLRLGACELSSVAPEDSPYHLTSPEGPTSASHSRSARASRSPTAPRVARAISSRGNLGVRSMYSSPLASWYVSANCV